MTAKKLVSTEDLALLVRGEDITYRLLFCCVFNRLKGERRRGRYARGFCESHIARDLPCLIRKGVVAYVPRQNPLPPHGSVIFRNE